jgi:ABC-type transporter Mla subunit MlaD
MTPVTDKRTPIRELFDQLDQKLAALDAAKDKHDKATVALKAASAAYDGAIAEVEALQAQANQAMAERLPQTSGSRIRAAS